MKRVILSVVAVVACILLAVAISDGRPFHLGHAAKPASAAANLPVDVHYKSLTTKPGFKSGVYTAPTGLITTLVQKSLYQNYQAFPSMSLTITGAQAPIADFTLSSGSTETLPDALGNVQVANLQMLTIWTDSLDVTVSCGTTTAFGTSAGTLAIKQGVPYEWDTSNGTATLPFTSWNSLSVTAGTSGTTSGVSAASSNIHFRSSLSQ